MKEIFDHSILDSLLRLMRLHHDVVYVFDLEKLALRYDNGRLHDLLGYTREEFDEHSEGRFLGSFIHPGDHVKFMNYNRELIGAKGNRVHNLTIRVNHKSGTVLRLYTQDMPLHREGKKVRTIVGTCMDITRLEGLQEGLRTETGEVDDRVLLERLVHLKKNLDGIFHVSEDELRRLHELLVEVGLEQMDELLG